MTEGIRKYFVNFGDDITYYDTEAEAKIEAELAIEWWIKQGRTEWSGDAETIHWGMVMQKAKVTKSRRKTRYSLEDV